MALASALSGPLLTWFKLVNDTVTEPYLDEVFHVRQAQQYCQHRFDVWDPKITTPPGIYLLSYILSPAAGCNLIGLRSLSLFCLCTLQVVMTWTYATRRTSDRNVWQLQHSALNIALFPPLFFFSALYYTDVASTLSVLLFHWVFLQLNRSATPTWLRVPFLVLLGANSLLLRQTNIFWVSVFPAAVVLVNELDRGHRVVKDSMHRRVEGFGDGILSVAKTSWKMDVVFDPPVRAVWLEDYAKTVASIVACSLKVLAQPKRISGLLVALAPYITLLGLFGAFVMWNGGVVLGDKGNHVATLHLPQMLYIWPYFVFFSWSLVYQYLATLALGSLAKAQDVASLDTMLVFKRQGLLPRFRTLGLFTAIALMVVHFNTIVHPFTLADNRHYTFYVFRLLMRPWWVKYAVTPVYVVCGWACIQALGATSSSVTSATDSATSKTTTPEPEDAETQPASPVSLPDGTHSATISFVLIWLATTTLQLITAPLVEPRYFILPWIFWRMHLPLQSNAPANSRNEQSLRSRVLAVDHRLWIESAWLLLINAATGYIFLNWEFSWLQEPGNVQRFMW